MSDEYDPEAYTPCWNCPLPTCADPPTGCHRKRRGTFIALNLAPDEQTEARHIQRTEI
jgi:hypothetical protein